VLIATSSLDVLNTSDQVLVDDVMVEIKIIEEWGFHLGDDVCLYDEEEKDVSESHGNVDMNGVFENNEHVEILADKIVQELREVNDTEGVNLIVTGKETVETTNSIKVLDNCQPNGDLDSPPEVQQIFEVPTSSETSVCKDDSGMENDNQATMGTDSNEEVPGAGASTLIMVSQNSSAEVGSKRKTVRNDYTSCSLGNSGPWSVDWLQNIQQGDIGLISSKNKRLKKVGNTVGGKGGRLLKNKVKKKAGGVLRHPVLTLKKVARLPSKDREEVMKVLRKSQIMKVLKQKIQNRRRQRERVTRSLEVVSLKSQNESSTSGSVNNDWSNWVALNGSEVAKAEDAKYIGSVIGVSFEGDCFNKFSVLSRQKKGDSRPVLKPAVDEREAEDEGV
jgi:hypothetical protein